MIAQATKSGVAASIYFETNKATLTPDAGYAAKNAEQLWPTLAGQSN